MMTQPASRFDEHGRGNFAGKRALLFPVQILSGDGDVGIGGGFHSRGDGGKWWRNHDVAMRDA